MLSTSIDVVTRAEFCLGNALSLVPSLEIIGKLKTTGELCPSSGKLHKGYCALCVTRLLSAMISCTGLFRTHYCLPVESGTTPF